MVNDLCVSAKFAGKQRKGLMLTTSLQPVDVEGTMIFSTTHSGRNPGTWSTPEITLICLSISISFISVGCRCLHDQTFGQQQYLVITIITVK